jgi:hypothetical protein
MRSGWPDETIEVFEIHKQAWPSDRSRPTVVIAGEVGAAAHPSDAHDGVSGVGSVSTGAALLARDQRRTSPDVHG